MIAPTLLKAILKDNFMQCRQNVDRSAPTYVFLEVLIRVKLVWQFSKFYYVFNILQKKQRDICIKKTDRTWCGFK